MLSRTTPLVQTVDGGVIITEAEPSAYCITLENLASKSDAWLGNSMAACHAHAYRTFCQSMRLASQQDPDVDAMSLTRSCRGAYVIRFETLEGANEACCKAYDAKARDSLFIPTRAYWKSAQDVSLDKRMAKLLTRLDVWDPRDYFALVIGILGAARDMTYYCMVILHRECSMTIVNSTRPSKQDATIIKIQEIVVDPTSQTANKVETKVVDMARSKPSAIVFANCPMCPETKPAHTIKCLFCDDVQYCSIEHCKMHTSHALWCSRKHGR